jgi:hypothetical protein
MRLSEFYKIYSETFVVGLAAEEIYSYVRDMRSRTVTSTICRNERLLCYCLLLTLNGWKYTTPNRAKNVDPTDYINGTPEVQVIRHHFTKNNHSYLPCLLRTLTESSLLELQYFIQNLPCCPDVRFHLPISILLHTLRGASELSLVAPL